MASDTVPAAVPGPTDPPPSTAPAAPAGGGTQQSSGGLTGLLASVEPTRSPFQLGPAQTTDSTAENQAAIDVSSTSFGTADDADTPSDKDGKTGKGKQEQRVIRAWLLAGAERWRKGGDARLKALDIRKAKAQASQVKENVTVNRSEKMVGGSTNSSTGSKTNGPGKSLNSKSSGSGNGSGKEPKNQSSGTKNAGGGRASGSGSSGQSGNNSRGGSGSGRTDGSNRKDSRTGGRGDSKGRGDSGKQPPRDTGRNHGQKTNHQKLADGAAKTNGGGGGAGKAGTQSPTGKPGRDAAALKPARTDKGVTKPSTTGPDSTPRKKTEPVQGLAGKDSAGKVRLDKASHKKHQRPDNATGDDKTRTPDKTSKDAKKTDEPPPQTQTTPKTSDKNTADNTSSRTPRINLQTSREAGYRDGTRAAKATAHAQAWRDGVRDGWTDTRQAADRETQRLDQAHADRKKTRTSPEDTPVTQPATSADHQPTVPPKPDHAPGPQPVTVTSIDANTVYFGNDAARSSMSRGEVRTLRRFQQRLDTKTDRMTAVAEATRALEHHANEQAKQVTQLLEQARSVKGGDKLVAALTKLADDAQVQATKAAEIHKRAARSSEACKTLTSNTDTRYGGIYQAVVDSPETKPAEMNYYREMTHA